MAASVLSRRKRAAAQAAVAEVESGMIVGLGTGSTAAFAIAALAERVIAGLAVEAVATSLRTADVALGAGIRLIDFADVAAIDLCIDGVDEIDPQLRAIKGGGGAMLREKVVATAAARMIAIADDSKQVDRLGCHPLPLEVLPFALAAVERAASELGGTPALRLRDGRPATSDQGNLLVDCRFEEIPDPPALAAALAAIPGLLEHGLFLTEIDAAYIADAAGVRLYDRMVANPATKS